MNRKIAAFVGVICAIAFAVWAANPSFSSFNTNQFGTAGNTVNISSGVDLTNLQGFGTSSFTNSSGYVFIAGASITSTQFVGNAVLKFQGLQMKFAGNAVTMQGGSMNLLSADPANGVVIYTNLVMSSGTWQIYGNGGGISNVSMLGPVTNAIFYNGITVTNPTTSISSSISNGVFYGSAAGLTNAPAGSFVSPTNSLTQTVALNYQSYVEGDFQTNAAFSFVGFTGISTTNYQTAVVWVKNSTGSAVAITQPSNVHTNGVFYVTNLTEVVFKLNPNYGTNMFCLPLW